MRILMTNARLDIRGGAESAVRQHARALQRLGHVLIGFSSDPRQQPRLLQNDAVPVATALAGLPVAPDVIHAQHHLDAMTTISALTDVPMVFQCPPTSWPRVPVHPRIYAYLAVSPTQADLVRQSVPASTAVHVWRRPLDLERLNTVRTLPLQPWRALLFNRRRPGDGALVSALHAALTRRGITLDFVSSSFDRSVDDSEALFAQYDIVFTSGDAAAEAIACGCAVVITRRGSLGEMVLPSTVVRLAAQDFQAISSSATVSDADVDAEVERYSAANSSAVTTRLRSEVDSARAFAELVGIYEDVVSRHRAAMWDPAADLIAVSRYLGQIAPAITTLNHELSGQWASPDRDQTFYDLRARLTMLQERLRSR